METQGLPGQRPTRIAGWLLIVLGAFVAIIGYSAATTVVEGIDYAPAFAPYLYGLSVPPLVAGVGTLRRKGWAYGFGVVIGLFYGVASLAVSNGATPPLIFGLGFIGSAVLLVDASRRRSMAQR